MSHAGDAAGFFYWLFTTISNEERSQAKAAKIFLSSTALCWATIKNYALTSFQSR
jgi:hypothetical protein